MTPAPSQIFAAELLSSLVRLGVRNFYLAPGARSQALAIAAGQLHEAGVISLTVMLDERSMAFAALGRALGSKTPSVLITTSGTAVANLHPALLEASHSGVPLIALTSDRPASLRQKGANQTTNQVGIFATALRFEIDVPPASEDLPDSKNLAILAVSHAAGNNPGPVQLNLQFREPLSSYEPNAFDVFQKLSLEPIADQVDRPSELDVLVDDQTVVIAGAGAKDAAVEFARRANLPLFAEPSSGSRYGIHAINGYVNKLKGPLRDSISRVIIFGKPTLSRQIVSLIKDSEVWVAKSKTHGHFDVASNSLGFADILVPLGQGSDAWLRAWNEEVEVSGSRQELVFAVWEKTSGTDRILFGASELIRQADYCLPGKEVSVFSNRGLSGIDGTVSTALGLSQDGNQVRAVLGDLTLLHDAGGLNHSGFDSANVQLIIGSDNGGQIFSHLEMAKTLPKELFEKLFTTPQRVSLDKLAAAYGWKYFRTESALELQSVLDEKGLVLIEHVL